LAVAVRDARPRAPRDDAGSADRELRKLRARWRTASLANGWRFPSDWPVPEVDEVCASLIRQADVCAALASLARARAAAGAGLEETLSDLAALHAVVSDPANGDGLVSADPDATPTRLVRVAALAWADESIGELTGARYVHGLTGLATESYLRLRLSEVYRRAERAGRQVRDGHVLLVITLDLTEIIGWPRLAAMVLVADALREVFNGGESAAVLGPSVAVVLADRDPSFGERALSFGWLINERLHADPHLRAGRRPDLRVVGLPDTEDEAWGLLNHLGRA
jgi:hypothetical protein